MKKPDKNPELSIIILTYNNEGQIIPCLDSIYEFNRDKFTSHLWELVLVDNNSADKTLSLVQKNSDRYPNLAVIASKENTGFGAGNNLGASQAKGHYILFLNPDTVCEEKTIRFPLVFLKSHPDVGAVGAKTVLGNGELDATCHRGFPTPWRGFCYFSGLTKLFTKSKLFAGYTLGYLDLNSPHEVDAINGAYFMLPKSVGIKLRWFDTDFFWKGEDLDLCYRIKESGLKIIYLPQVKIWHFKGSSKGHRPGSKTRSARFEAMRLFYDKHYRTKYPPVIRDLTMFGIKLRELVANLGL